MSKIIVIGANHAGTACINTILSNYKEHEVVVYDKNNNISFLGCGMALWIGNQIKSSDGLFYSDKEKLESLGAKVNMESNVEKIDFDKKEVLVTLKDGSKIIDNYDKLVLATGSRPVKLNIKGNDLNNIYYAKLFQDAQKVKAITENKDIKKVAVLGAGYIGVELAEAFQRLGMDVVLINRNKEILASYFDTEYNEKMKVLMEKNGIKMALGETVEEFIGDENGNVKFVKTNKDKHEVDMVLSSIGFIPNSELGRDKLEVFKNCAYLVNKKQETSIKDVYAIGDCATVYDLSIDKSNYIALATNAVRSGIVAAHNVCNTQIESIGVAGSSAICIYGLKMLSVGLTEKSSKLHDIEVLTTSFKDKQKPEFMENNNPDVEIKITYRKDNRQIVGAQLVSEYDMSGTIHLFSLAIYKKLTIDELALLDIFFMPHFNKPYNYITMSAITAK